MLSALLVLATALTGCAGASTVPASPTSASQNISRQDTSSEPSVTLQPTASPDHPTAALATDHTAASSEIPAPGSATRPPSTPATPTQRPTLHVPTVITPAHSIIPTPAPKPIPAGSTGAQSRWIGPYECQGDDVTYTAPPVSLEDTWIIEPMGKLHGSHVTPTDHTYIRHNQLTPFR